MISSNESQAGSRVHLELGGVMPRPREPLDGGALDVPRSVQDAGNSLLDLRKRTRVELDGVVVGYDEPLDLMLVAAVAGGHVLLEGPPGVAKTLMAGAIARVLGVSFKRVQFTPDTAPEEITGRIVTRAGETIFAPGAAFTNVLLADEINRTPPRTQAALLEAMQERHVTVGGRTHWLPTPFMVVATQNPYEQEGIFRLPESQLDRFLFKISLDYSSAAEEEAILRLPHRVLAPDVLGDVLPLLDVATLDAAQHELETTPVPDDVISFVVDIVRCTRELSGVILGASPRAAIHLLSAAKAHARLANRSAVTREDVADMAVFALSHRLILVGAEASAVVSEAVAVASHRKTSMR
jgi:MoxR-like ATPase